MSMLEIFTTLQSIFHYQFMQNAFIIGTLISITGGIMGYLVVLRRTAFAAHAYSEIGFAGAAGANLLQVGTLIGALGGAVFGGLAIAILGRRATHRDVEIGSVLAFSLGLGWLFLSLSKGNDAQNAVNLLFGEILGVSSAQILITAIVSAVILVALALVYRPLLFASLDEDVAEAKGMHTLLLGGIFMVLLAAAVSIAIQATGVLLIFALMVTPAATAVRLTKKPVFAIVASVAIALFATWSGLIIAYFSNFPVSFFITTIVFALYIIVRIFRG
jgi:zinc/manganese transport system permease protein